VDIHFSCTLCGKCCQDLKLPLTIAEATRWLNDGNDLQVLCEAVPWLAEPAAKDLQAAHRRRRSFATASGSMPTRVIVILAASFAGNCPYLQADMKCGMYPTRPLVCRIYPAEINPFIALNPANKGCPPEAWAPSGPLLERKGRLMDAHMRELIEISRDTDMREVEAKRRLCAALGFDATAMSGEGFVVYSPERSELLAELCSSRESADAPRTDTWRFISNRATTIDALAALGAVGTLVGAGDRLPFEYLGFKPATAG
jgi:Fe-S-cluster containining protein